MKRIFILLAFLLLLSGCSQEIPDAGESIEAPFETLPVSQPTASPESYGEETRFTEETVNPLELSSDAYQVVYNIILDDNQESAVFQGIGPDGSLAWIYETEAYELAQMSRISPIGRYQDTYYLAENGTVTALNILTGEVLFQNEEFMGCPAPDAMLIDEFGYLYLAGYDGPDFFAMDPQGNTVKRIASLSEDFSLPFKIDQEGDQLVIYMESDSNGNTGSFPCYLERSWLPQAKG